MDIYEENSLIGSVRNYKNVPQTLSINYMKAHKVQDNVRGYLVYNGTAWSFKQKSQYKPKAGYKKLALILESPHKDEYRIKIKGKLILPQNANSQLIPQRPANGFAGNKIDNYIQNRLWISQLCKSVDYEVFIMNVIQYQCSAFDYIIGLNKSHRGLTDAIFSTMWYYSIAQAFPFQDDFKKRIQDYSPDIIINACTKGKRKTTLQHIVNDFIVEQLLLSPINDYHPATIGKNIWK